MGKFIVVGYKNKNTEYSVMFEAADIYDAKKQAQEACVSRNFISYKLYEMVRVR